MTARIRTLVRAHRVEQRVRKATHQSPTNRSNFGWTSLWVFCNRLEDRSVRKAAPRPGLSSSQYPVASLSSCSASGLNETFTSSEPVGREAPHLPNDPPLDSHPRLDRGAAPLS